jgi:hypothetical protein
MMPNDPEFFTARQLMDRWQLKRRQSVYALPIRRIRVGRFVRFPKRAVLEYENRGCEPVRERQSA